VAFLSSVMVLAGCRGILKAHLHLHRDIKIPIWHLPVGPHTNAILPLCCRTSGAASASGAMLVMGSSAWKKPCPPQTGAWKTTGSAIGRPFALTCTFMVSVLNPAVPGLIFRGEVTLPHPSPSGWGTPWESRWVGCSRGQGLISVAWSATLCGTEDPLWAVLSVPTPGAHATAPRSLLALYSVLILPGLGILQIRLWAYFTCSHPEKSTTSLTSRLRRPVPRKVLPWPLSNSSRQHNRSGQGCRGWAGRGHLHPLVGWGRAVLLPGRRPAVASLWCVGGRPSRPWLLHLHPRNQEGCWVLPVTVGRDLCRGPTPVRCWGKQHKAAQWECASGQKTWARDIFNLTFIFLW